MTNIDYVVVSRAHLQNHQLSPNDTRFFVRGGGLLLSLVVLRLESQLFMFVQRTPYLEEREQTAHW